MRAGFFILYLLLTPAAAQKESYLGISCFSIEASVSDYYNSLDILLFQRLNFELLPRGVKPVLLNDTLVSDCIAVISGTITLIANEPVLVVTITKTPESEGEIKKIPLKDQLPDAVIDLLAIKVRHFLEQNISGKLRITSLPLDCSILLNGITIGKTPAELVLEQGTYAIELQREYLQSFSDSVKIYPGKETDLQPTLSFKGRTLKPWITSAIIFTGCTIIAQIIEMQLHNRYKNLTLEEWEKDNNIFTKRFNQYKIANTVRISFFIPTATAWTIAGFMFFENRSLKESIYK